MTKTPTVVWKPGDPASTKAAAAATGLTAATLNQMAANLARPVFTQ